MKTINHNPLLDEQHLDIDIASWKEEELLFQDEDYREALNEEHDRQIREIAHDELSNMRIESGGFSDWNID